MWGGGSETDQLIEIDRQIRIQNLPTPGWIFLKFMDKISRSMQWSQFFFLKVLESVRKKEMKRIEKDWLG